MAKQMTYKKLMKMVEEGDALVIGIALGDESLYLVETYDREGRAKRAEVTVTHRPKNEQPEAQA